MEIRCVEHWDLFIQNTGQYFILNTMGRFIYTKYWGLLYVEHCGKIIYTKYLVILYFEQCGKIYLHKILKNTLCWTLGIFIYTKYWGLLFVEHCGKIYLHKILGTTLCWTLWEDLFTQNTVEYCMWNTVGRFIYTKYRGIMYVEHCGDIYLHNILGITLWWALWEYLFTQNTEEYCMLSTVGRFIYTKYQGILYVEHCGKIYFHKILRNTSCWALWEDLFTQNTEEYFMLSTVRFIYTKYPGILYAELCGKIYLHKILRNTLC